MLSTPSSSAILSYAGFGAVATAILAGWNQVRDFFSRLTLIFLDRATVEGEAALGVVALGWHLGFRRVLQRIGHRAEEHGVLLVPVPPAHTSQRCPACSTVHRLNRKGEEFACRSCGYAADADTVGACNILALTLRSLGSTESPRLDEHAAILTV
jgi:hypothetical protein